MELRDVVEVIAGLDDERRAIGNGVHRALDALERAVLPAERFGVLPARVDALRERVQHGLPEGAILQEIGDQIRERLVEDAKLEGERFALLAADENANLRARLGRFADRLGGAIDHSRNAHEQIGALRALLSRRRDVEATLQRLHASLSGDDVTAELLDVTLAARKVGEHAAPLSARQFLLAAESAASSSGILAGVASNARALREALRLGRDPSAVALDLRQRAFEAARRAWADRDEARRQLALVGREAERRQEISHGMFQAVTKATEVLERLDRFERLPDSQRLADGALGALKGACLEHGIISVLVGLREVSVDRADLEVALSQLSQSLGDLLGLLADRPEDAARVVPAWDDIAAVEARTQESEWESACREAMGVRRDAQGLLSVAPETLATLVSADSLTPFRDRLFHRVETKMAEVLRATERLEGLDRALSDLCDEGGDLADHALRCKAALTRFIGEALHVMGECHSRFRDRLHSEATGFAQVETRVAPFAEVEDAAGDEPKERKALIASALGTVRELFAELETRLPGGGPSAAQARETDERLSSQATALQERLAESLASLGRLRELLLPPLPMIVLDAVALAERLRDGDREAASLTRDQLGEALESLLHERLYHEALDLAHEPDTRPLAALVAERDRRLLEIVGASLTLAFRLLGVLAEEHERLGSAEREAHLEWMDELVAHVHAEMSLFGRLFDRTMTELPDNSARLRRHGIALDAYAGFLAALEGTSAAEALSSRHGATLHEGFEAPLGRVGCDLLDRLDPDVADWRATSQLEGLIELHDSLLARLAAAPLRTDVAAEVHELRARAVAIRDAILARADSMDDDDSRTGRLFL